MQESVKKYRVLNQIGQGGMAEVYCAEMQCQPGYSKRVAIKRVLERLTKNKRFIRMFLDEARLGLLLNHANIVQVFDVGRADDAYFIVMEFVDGVSLKDVWEETQRAPLPIELSCHIALEICRGLDYAHRLADTNGKPLNVVHHDVNPANVLLSLEGEVKLVDFGLAEAAVHAQRNDPDLVRGKFGYLSPEAALGLGTDARSDIFACATILYELTTGRRLFFREGDLESVQAARAAVVPPPRRENPAIPLSLEQTLYRALARDPAQRFQTARSFGRALSDIMFEIGRPVSAFAIADLVSVVRGHRREVEEEEDPMAAIASMIQDELAGLDFLDHSDAP